MILVFKLIYINKFGAKLTKIKQNRKQQSNNRNFALQL